MGGSNKVQILTNLSRCLSGCNTNPIYKDYLLQTLKGNSYVSSANQYLKTNNYLSEYNTPLKKFKARNNLGIEGLAYWGNILGHLEDLLDLANYIKLITDKIGIEVVETLSEYTNPNPEIGLLLYVRDEDTTYLYNGKEFRSFDSLVVSNLEPNNKNVLWVDLDGNDIINQAGNLNTLQTQIKTLQILVALLMNIVKYGAVAGDSSSSTRINILKSSEPINPTDEEIDSEDDLIEPTSSGLYPTIPHLSIKMDTLENFVKNKRNLIDGELIWITDKGKLFIFIDGIFKPISSGTINDDNLNENDMTQEDIEALYFNLLGFIDKNNNQYYLQINEEGNIIVYDSSNYDGEYLGSSLETTSEVGGSYISNYLRINSVFFGGLGTAIDSFCGATHNFVELANGSDKNINLNGVYLMYCDDTSTQYWDYLPLRGTIKAGSTFLIRGALCSVKTNTNVTVDSYDMQWYDANNKLKLFDANGGSFYLVVSQENKIYNPSIQEFVNVSEFPIAINPYDKNSNVPIGYIDLVGVGAGKKAENTPIYPNIDSNITDCIFFRLYTLDPGYGTVLKVWSKRNTANFWTYCDMTKKYSNNKPYFTEKLKQRLSPKSSIFNKNFFNNKQVFSEESPNIITLTLGKQGTVQQNTLATRCLNWVSVGYYDEYVEYKKDSDTTWTKVYSFDGSNSEDPVLTTYSLVYKRFRWVSSNGTAVTTHKVILRNLSEGIYSYRIGRDNSSYSSEEKTFVIKADVNNFNFIHVSDQQGFNYNEYCAWIKAANTIKNSETYDFIINTGDMTQSGDRENEWLDYDMGRLLLGNVPEMACIGNNDLCGLNLFKLGKGIAGTDKINSQTIWLFYTFELDIDNSTYFHFKYSDNGVGKLDSDKIGNVLTHTSEKFEYFMPSVYSFDYGEYHFICLNSEFATNSKVYSIYYDDSNIESIFKLSAYYLLYRWLKKDIELNPNKKYVCFHHEIPFNIIKLDDDGTTIARTANNGSLLNTDFSNGVQYTDYTDNSDYTGGCCFSEFFLNNNIKLVLGGHKHTYSLSHPTVENVLYVTTEGSTVRVVDYKNPYVITNELIDNPGINYTTAVVYCMTQATGFKLESNKDKPGNLEGSVNTNWLYHFYPYGFAGGKPSKLNPGLLYPMYSNINCNEGVLTLKSYAIDNIYIHTGETVTPFNINNLSDALVQLLQKDSVALSCLIDYVNNTVKYQDQTELNISN